MCSWRVPEGPWRLLAAKTTPEGRRAIFWRPLGPSWARRRGAQNALGSVLAVLGPSAGASGKLLEASWPSWGGLGPLWGGRVGSSWGRLSGLEKRAKTLEGWSFLDFPVGYGGPSWVGKGGQDRPRQAKTGQDRPRHAKTSQDKTGQERQRQDKTGQDKPRQAKTSQEDASSFSPCFHAPWGRHAVFWTPLGPSSARRRGAQLGPSAGASGTLLEASWPSWVPIGPLWRGRVGSS